MIKILGFRRIIILAVLLALNTVFGLSAYMYFMPQKTSKDRELRTMRGKVSTLKADIDGLLVEFDQLDQQLDTYKALKDRGFFDTQSRRKAELVLQEIQDRSSVISAVASIAGGEFGENTQAIKADHQILKSPIQINIEALNDLDVYRYIYLMDEYFPGHISIENISIKRESDLNGVVLRAIASKNPPPLVKANLELSWRTMIPITTDETNNGGGQ